MVKTKILARKKGKKEETMVFIGGYREFNPFKIGEKFWRVSSKESGYKVTGPYTIIRFGQRDMDGPTLISITYEDRAGRAFAELLCDLTYQNIFKTAKEAKAFKTKWE